MKIRYFLFLISFALLQEIHAKNEDILTDIVSIEWNQAENHGPNKAYSVNWNKIFKTIDENAINPATFRWGDNMSLLKLAIMVNRLDQDVQESQIREKESFDAIKKLLEKYHIFRHNVCGGDDCNELFALALQSNLWPMSEGYPNLAIVDIMLKHRAQANQKTKNDIKKIYDGLSAEQQKKYPYIKSLFRK